MAKKSLKIIGINPGTRHLGIAIFLDSDLRDWRVKSFREKWSKEKMEKIRKTILSIINQYKADHEMSLKLQGKNPFDVSIINVHTGNSFFIMGEIDQAISFLKRAKEVREKEKVMPDYQIQVYGRLAQAYLKKIRCDKVTDKKERKRLLKLSKKDLGKALKFQKNHPNYRANAFLVAGIYNWVNKKKKKAHMWFERSRQVAEQQSGKMYLAEAYYEEGRCILEDGEPISNACEYLEKALSLYKECGAKTYITRTEELLGKTSIKTTC